MFWEKSFHCHERPKNGSYPAPVASFTFSPSSVSFPSPHPDQCACVTRWPRTVFMARWGDPVQVKSKGLLWDRRLNEIDTAPNLLKQKPTKGSRRQRMSIMGKMGEWQVCVVCYKTKRLRWKSLKTVKVSTCCRMRLQRHHETFFVKGEYSCVKQKRRAFIRQEITKMLQIFLFWNLLFCGDAALTCHNGTTHCFDMKTRGRWSLLW